MTVAELRAAPVDIALTVEAKALRDVRVIRLDVEPQRIGVDSVRIASGPELGYVIESGEPNAYGLTGSRLAIDLGEVLRAGSTVRILIRYRAQVDAAQQRGLFVTPDFHGAAVLTTRSWPYFARYWLPSDDHPSDGAEFQFTISVPANAVAVANGALTSATSTSGGTTYVWEQRTPIPTYSAQITIGNLQSAESTICFDRELGKRLNCGERAAQVPLLFVYPASLQSREVYETQIDKAANALAYFSVALGPYRFAKAGFAVVPHPFNMESASIVTLVTPGAAVHETLHHWWGNSVHIASWGDFWISEGLTTYFTGFFDETATGVNSACMVRTRQLDVAPDQDPLDAFNTDPYCVGAAAVDDARQTLARLMNLKTNDPAAMSAFLAVFRTVHDEYASRAISTRGLRRALTAAMFTVLQSQGSTRTFAEIDSAMQQWEQGWFVDVPAETGPRRRIVHR